MRDFTAAGLNFSLKLGLMEDASSAAGIAGRGNGGGENLVNVRAGEGSEAAASNASGRCRKAHWHVPSHAHAEVRARSASV